MGKTCSWGTCNSDSRYPERLTGGVKFFPFPKWRRSLPNNREKCMQWIKACNRPHYQLNINKVENSYSRYVCSKHFVDGKPTKENPYPVDASDNQPSSTAPPTKLPASGPRVLRGARKSPKVATKDKRKGGSSKGKRAAVQPDSKKKRTQRKVLALCEDDSNTQLCSQGSSNGVDESSSEKQDSKMICFVPVTQYVPVYIPVMSQVQGSGQNCWQPVFQSSGPASTQSLGPQPSMPAHAPIPVTSLVQSSGQSSWQPELQSSGPACPFPVMSQVQNLGQNCWQPVLQSSGPASTQSLAPQLCLPACAPVPVMSQVQGTGVSSWQPVLQSSDPASRQSLGPRSCLPAHAPVPVMLIGPQEKELLSQMCSARVESSVEEAPRSSIQQDFSEQQAVASVLKKEPFEGDSHTQSCREQGITHTSQEHAALPLAEVKIEPTEDGFHEHEVTQALQECGGGTR